MKDPAGLVPATSAAFSHAEEAGTAAAMASAGGGEAVGPSGIAGAEAAGAAGREAQKATVGYKCPCHNLLKPRK